MDQILENKSATVVLPMQQPLHWSIAYVLLERRMCLRGQFYIFLHFSEFFFILNIRSIQQLSECTDGLKVDAGRQLERVNQHCVTGFPDVHMMLIMTELNGTLEAETINPESVEKKECRVEVEDRTGVRMTDFKFDYFTDETYLTDALATGPVATNIGLTPAMQHYAEGVYYNSDECVDYVDEDVPEECLEIRSGRTAFTCLKVETDSGLVNCAELMPKHCGLFFNTPTDTYQHSITAVGYGMVRDKSMSLV